MKKILSIRGATVCENTAESVCERTQELIAAIIKENALKQGDIVNCTFSTTEDITAFYPAAAARKAGLLTCPLFSCAEPNIDNSLKRCIRVMLTVRMRGNAVHCYLHEAKELRPDLAKGDINEHSH